MHRLLRVPEVRMVDTLNKLAKLLQMHDRTVFFKENVRNPVWICRDPIFLILGTRLSLILVTR